MSGSLTQWLPPPDPSGPVTCAACGCRMTETYLGDRRAWLHFASLHPDQDARGCRPRCLGVPHGRDGRALDLDAITPASAVVAFLVADGVDEPIGAEEGAAA